MKPIKVLIACNNNLLCKGIAKILTEDPEIEIVGELGDGQDVLKKIEALAPQVALIEFFMVGLNGLEVVRRIKKIIPNTKIVIFSIFDLKEDSIFETLEAGTSGILDKSCTHHELRLAIKAAVGGKAYISPGVSSMIINNINEWKRQPKERRCGKYGCLTPREREIIQLIAEGFTCVQIADKLCISATTVNRHKASFMEKLNMKNVVEIVKYAIESKIVRLDSCI